MYSPASKDMSYWEGTKHEEDLDSMQSDLLTRADDQSHYLCASPVDNGHMCATSMHHRREVFQGLAQTFIVDCIHGYQHLFRR